MINWAYFPKNQKCDDVSEHVIGAFINVADKIDSDNYQYESDSVLAIVRPELEKLGFSVEKSKKKSLRENSLI